MNNKTAPSQRSEETRSAVIRIIKYLEGCQKTAAFGDNGKARALEMPDSDEQET